MDLVQRMPVPMSMHMRSGWGWGWGEEPSVQGARLVRCARDLHQLPRAGGAQLAQQHARVEQARPLDGVRLEALHEAHGRGGELIGQRRQLLAVLLRHRHRAPRRHRRPLLASAAAAAAAVAAATAAPLGRWRRRGVGGSDQGGDGLYTAAAQHAQHARLDRVGILANEAWRECICMNA